MQNNKTGKLFLIPTPLAENTASAVLPPQVLEQCRSLRHYLCEDIRTSRRFLSSLRLGLTIEELTMAELSKDTPDAEVAQLLHPLQEGYDMGVLSEAGCPAVADPGARAVAYAHRLGIQVVPLVGPSSILLALMASGLHGQNFAFTGYLPINKSERIQAIRELEKNARAGQSQLFMETPYRNNHLLEDLLQTCTGDILLSIASNINAPDEFIRTLSINSWKKELPDLHKKPTIFIIGSTSPHKKGMKS